MKVDGLDQVGALQRSRMGIPFAKATDIAMPLVECALTGCSRLSPWSWYANWIICVTYLASLCDETGRPCLGLP